MVGYKTALGDIAPKWHAPLPNAYLWKDGTPQPLQAGQINERSAFGPELSFAHSFGPTAEQPLLIVKVAQNASYLASDWDPDVPGGLFARLTAEIRAAMMERTVRLRGLLWMQGEADSIEADHANAYRDNLEAFITALRLEIGAPALPVVAGLIDPPQGACPHADTVRAALSDNALPAFHTIDCKGLPKRRDNLHFAPKGLSILGRRFAQALKDIPVSPLQTRWLRDGPQYQVWQQGPDLNGPDHAVAYPFATRGSGLREPGFGQPFFAKNKINATYIRADQSNWFQDDHILDVARSVREALPANAAPVLYGASMGAYGALLTSGILKPAKVIAVAPQYSIDRAQVPWEVRWKRAAKKIGAFRHRLEDTVCHDAPKYIFFDPLSLDRAQVAMMPTGASWRRVPLPFSSHQVLQALLESRCLPLLMAGLFETGPDTDALKAAWKAARRGSKIYWMSLADKASKKRPDLARAAYANALECGAPPRKVRRLLASLDDDD